MYIVYEVECNIDGWREWETGRQEGPFSSFEEAEKIKKSKGSSPWLYWRVRKVTKQIWI